MRKIPKAKVQRNFLHVDYALSGSHQFIFLKKKTGGQGKEEDRKESSTHTTSRYYGWLKRHENIAHHFERNKSKKKKKKKKTAWESAGRIRHKAAPFMADGTDQTPGVDQRVLLLGDTTQHNFS